MSTPGHKYSSPGKPLLTALSLALRLLAILGVLGLLLFVPAGRLNWVEAWVFIVAYGVFLSAHAIWGLSKDPAQLQERSRVGPNVKGWDKAIMAAYTVLLLVTLVVSGLDAGRFRWAPVALPLEVAAWIGQAAAGALIFWVVATNTYLSRMARIQEDRGQVTVTSGPYRFVRHPMYAGIIVLFVCVPVALGSGWGLVPGIAIGLLYLVRTSKEDQMLRQELAGYEAYARQVRYRLVPGVW
jgi:protein-S-isoprenylcysteine O-methyltransferase Ste14